MVYWLELVQPLGPVREDYSLNKLTGGETLTPYFGRMGWRGVKARVLPSGHYPGLLFGRRPLVEPWPDPEPSSSRLSTPAPPPPATPQITQLKIDNNPFAKGFRDTGNGRREKR